MAHDIRGSAETSRLARGRAGGSVRLPGTEALARGAHALDANAHRDAVYLSPAAAAQSVIASGIFERIAADMIRIDREIKARATPVPSSWDEIMKNHKGPIVAMKGWGL